MRLELVKRAQESVYFIPVITLVFTNRPYIGGVELLYPNWGLGTPHNTAKVTKGNVIDFSQNTRVSRSGRQKSTPTGGLLVSNKGHHQTLGII